MRCLLLAVVLLLNSTLLLAENAGQIGLLNGTVFVIKPSGKRIVVAEGSIIENGDIVVTGNDSKAMVAFTDGGKIALRPNTTFQVAEYHYNTEQPQQDNAVFNLVKGGLRTITGFIGKRGNHDAYRLGNNTATIGIRGTEYMARVCDPSCEDDSAPVKKDKPIVKKLPIAKVVLLRGGATREGGEANDIPKPLAESDMLYLGDTVSTGNSGLVGLLFTDGSRVVIPANASFKLVDYRYSTQNADSNNMLVKLLKGSARIVTGLIGKHNPRSVNYQTNTATIGIRGTDFDMACVSSGSADENNTMATSSVPPTTECDQALVTSVRSGAVEMDSGKGTQRVESGKSGYTDAPAAQPKLLNSNPTLFGDDVPLPDTLKSDTVKEFGAPTTDMSNKGIYVSVIEGKVILQQGVSNLSLSQGQSGYANASGNQVQLLGSTPSGLNYDPFLQNVKFNAFSCGL